MDASIAVHVDGPYTDAYLAASWTCPFAARLAISTIAVRRPTAAVAMVVISRLPLSIEKLRLLTVVSLFVGGPTSAGIVANVLAAKTRLL